MISEPLFAELWSKISADTDLKLLAEGRNTVLQVMHVESTENPGEHYLLANTHLFFAPHADFLRLVQAIVGIRTLQNLKKEIEQSEGVNTLRLIIGGDFNACPTSHAYTYITTQNINMQQLSQGTLLSL